jgi:hypothetical protein
MAKRTWKHPIATGFCAYYETSSCEHQDSTARAGVHERSIIVVMSISMEKSRDLTIPAVGRSRKSKTVFRTLLPPQVLAARCSFPIATNFGRIC